jgi:hypothetical protein
MNDALSFEALMKLIPKQCWLTTVGFAIWPPTRPNCATLPDHDNNLAHAILVPANGGNAIFFS